MKKRVILFLLTLCISVSFLAAQQLGNVGEPDPAEIGVDTAQQSLREVSVTKFENAGFWRGAMPADMGIIETRRLTSEGPLDKEPIPGEEEVGIDEQDENVLGAKVHFFKRGHSYLILSPSRPLPIEGITKRVSVWVVGRNTRHVLSLLISDHFGNRAELTMGELNFTGWKQMTVAIPPSIVQRDYHYNNKMGIKIEGFKIDFDPVETYGRYYIYFDYMTAVTDLFAEESRDLDDMLDTW